MASQTEGADKAQTQRRSRRRWWHILLRAALVLVVLAGGGLWYAVHYILPYSIIGTDRSARWRWFPEDTPEKVGLQVDDFWCEVEPKLWIKGWFSHAAGPSRGTVFLLHGHNNCKESNLNLARLLAGRGFQCLLYDSRGCGESGGDFCTFGYYEHRDCSRCLDALLSRYGEAAIGPVAIYGSSFGGAVALQTLAEDPRFRCGVVESTFTSMREIVYDFTEHMAGFRLDSLVDAALVPAGTIANFPPDAVRPEEAASRIRQPTLLIHGIADADISFKYGERIFHRLASSPCSEWYPIPGGHHADLWKVGGEPYRQRLVGFLERWDR